MLQVANFRQFINLNVLISLKQSYDQLGLESWNWPSCSPKWIPRLYNSFDAKFKRDLTRTEGVIWQHFRTTGYRKEDCLLSIRWGVLEDGRWKKEDRLNLEPRDSWVFVQVETSSFIQSNVRNKCRIFANIGPSWSIRDDKTQQKCKISQHQ